MIHPFSDGNGRIARALQTLVLARSGILTKEFCSIEEYLGKNTQSYYAVLAEVGAGSWHPERDARPWVRYCLTAHFRQASTIVRRARVLQRIWEALEHETKARGLPDRMIPALGDAALGLRVRNATYRGSAGISNNTASRDLKVLTDEGLLLSQGEKRGRYYVASDILVRVGRSAASGEPKKVPDPFELIDYLPGLVPLA